MGGMSSVQPFFRYFKMPGVQHCWGTAMGGPWAIGGAGQAGATSSAGWSVKGFEDPQHDAMLALIDWVEKGKAVDSIIATMWRNQLDPSTGVVRQRPLCPYPKKQSYNGRGDVNKPDSWSCK